MNNQKNISKKELSKVLSERLKQKDIEISQKISMEIVTELFDTIVHLLSKSENSQISITRFGIFKKKYRKERKMAVAKNNPIVKKGTKIRDLSRDQIEEVIIPAKNILLFKSSKVLKLEEDKSEN